MMYMPFEIQIALPLEPVWGKKWEPACVPPEQARGGGPLGLPRERYQRVGLASAGTKKPGAVGPGPQARIESPQVFRKAMCLELDEEVARDDLARDQKSTRTVLEDRFQALIEWVEATEAAAKTLRYRKCATSAAATKATVRLTQLEIEAGIRAAITTPLGFVRAPLASTVDAGMPFSAARRAVQTLLTRSMHQAFQPGHVINPVAPPPLPLGPPPPAPPPPLIVNGPRNWAPPPLPVHVPPLPLVYGPHLPPNPVVSSVYGETAPDFTPSLNWPGYSADGIMPHFSRSDGDAIVPGYFQARDWPLVVRPIVTWAWARRFVDRRMAPIAWQTRYATGHWHKVIHAAPGDLLYSEVAPADKDHPGYFLNGDVDLDVALGFMAGGYAYGLDRRPNIEYQGRLFQVASVTTARSARFGWVKVLPTWRVHARKFQRWALMPQPEIIQNYLGKVVSSTPEETIKARWNLVITYTDKRYHGVLRDLRNAAVANLDTEDPYQVVQQLEAADAAIRRERGSAAMSTDC